MVRMGMEMDQWTDGKHGNESVFPLFSFLNYVFLILAFLLFLSFGALSLCCFLSLFPWGKF